MTTPETMRRRFEKRFAMKPKDDPCCLWFKNQQLYSSVVAFIESELATRDEYWKALRAKELGVLRGKMIGLHNVEEIDTVPLAHDAIDECVSLVDELIEKPTT